MKDNLYEQYLITEGEDLEIVYKTKDGKEQAVKGEKVKEVKKGGKKYFRLKISLSGLAKLVTAVAGLIVVINRGKGIVEVPANMVRGL